MPAPSKKIQKKVTDEDLDRWAREAREEYDKMSPEEKAKICPWLKYCEKVTPTTADQVPPDL
ncbi:hypothetical protein F5Y06DRAFT_294415 [Hypoxylon sp. FL0890]|nr:hypothetical protein F5Y06DRAFT_294415 [Hypoxylon sp. FL0890]